LVAFLGKAAYLALEPKVLYLALAGSASKLRLIHGFEDEFELEFEDD
jgi:hypothetical protein